MWFGSFKGGEGTSEGLMQGTGMVGVEVVEGSIGWAEETEHGFGFGE